MREKNSEIVITVVMIPIVFVALVGLKPAGGQYYYPLTTITIVKDAQLPNNNQFYNPTEIMVKGGIAVIWKNEDTVVHTATSGGGMTSDSKFDTGIIDIGQPSQPVIMPLESGQYPYFCALHPWMTGSVMVI
jgi:plastocyanin